MDEDTTNQHIDFSPRILNTTDFDELAGLLQLGSIALRQLSPGPFSGQLLEMDTEHLRLMRVTVNQRVAATGGGDDPRHVFGIQPIIDEASLWHDIDAPADALLYKPPYGRAGITVRSQDYQLVTVAVDAEVLEQEADAAGFADLTDQLCQACVLEIPSGPLDQLRQVLTHVLWITENWPQLLTIDEMRHQTERTLVTSVIHALAATSRSTAVVGRRKRLRRAVEAAVAYMEQNLGGEVSSPDICRAAGMSERTLRYGFQLAFRLSPMSYYRALRLHHVRHELIAENCRKVGQVARSAGFCHMSQFAQDYRRLFGELPSETVRGRAKGVAHE